MHSTSLARVLPVASASCRSHFALSRKRSGGFYCKEQQYKSTQRGNTQMPDPISDMVTGFPPSPVSSKHIQMFVVFINASFRLYGELLLCCGKREVTKRQIYQE